MRPGKRADPERPRYKTDGSLFLRRSLLFSTVLVFTVATSFAAGRRFESPSQRAASTAPPTPGLILANVERRNLREQLTIRGEARAEYNVTIGRERGIVTAMPVGAGDTIPEGRAFLEISGRPLILLKAELPMYRDLKPGMKGKDVAQLQRSLVRLGYKLDDTAEFDDATRAAVEQWYRSLGYEPRLTSEDAAHKLEEAEVQVQDANRAVTVALNSLELAQARKDSELQAASERTRETERELAAVRLKATHDLENAQVALDSAAQRLRKAERSQTATPAELEEAAQALRLANQALERTRLAGANAIASAGDKVQSSLSAFTELESRPGLEKEITAVEAARRAANQAEQNLGALRSSTGAMVPVDEVVDLPAAPAKVELLSVKVGSRATPDMLRLTSGAIAIEAALSPGAARTVRAQSPALLESGKVRVKGVVQSVEEIRPVTSDAAPKYVARIAPDSVDPIFLVADIRVTIFDSADEAAVLAVPVPAIYTDTGGRTYVTLLDNGREAVVLVDVGKSYGGYQQIVSSQPPLVEGNSVVVAR